MVFNNLLRNMRRRSRDFVAPITPARERATSLQAEVEIEPESGLELARKVAPRWGVEAVVRDKAYWDKSDNGLYFLQTFEALKILYPDIALAMQDLAEFHNRKKSRINKIIAGVQSGDDKRGWSLQYIDEVSRYVAVAGRVPDNLEGKFGDEILLTAERALAGQKPSNFLLIAQAFLVIFPDRLSEIQALLPTTEKRLKLYTDSQEQTSSRPAEARINVAAIHALLFPDAISIITSRGLDESVKQAIEHEIRDEEDCDEAQRLYYWKEDPFHVTAIRKIHTASIIAMITAGPPRVDKNHQIKLGQTGRVGEESFELPPRVSI